MSPLHLNSLEFSILEIFSVFKYFDAVKIDI